MKITAIRTITLRSVNTPPYACATGVFEGRGGLLVFIETDRGLTGLGECYASGSAFAPVVAAAVEQQLAPMLIGEDPTRIEHLWQKMFWRTYRHGRKGVMMNAMSGIDIALWDLFGKSVGAPVYKLLGACHDRIPAYASGGFYFEGQSTQAFADACAQYLTKGFKALKIKVARHDSLHGHQAWAGDRLHYRSRESEMRSASLEADIARVAAVREAIGREAGLAVDANCAWDLPTVVRFCRALESAKLLWIEEPIATGNVGALVELAKQLEVPIAGYETESGLDDWLALISKTAIDIAQPGITYVGGFSEFRRIGAIAEAHRMPVIPHSYSTAVALIASVHAACALPNAAMVEVDQHQNPLQNELLVEPIVVGSDGTIRPPEKPGLGIELAPAALEKYAIRRA